MSIFKVQIENFKRIVAVAIDQAGKIIEITGKNEQGKSSVLDAIEAALGGGRRAPDEPIRRGASKARVVLELEDLVVERVWSKKSDRLVVKNKDGSTFPRAQAKLDELVGGLAFDPLAFMALKPSEQRDTLLGLVGVDLDGFESRRQKIYDLRREANRRFKAVLARLDAAPSAVDGTPAQEVSVTELGTELQEAYRLQQGNEELRRVESQKSDAEIEAVEAHQRQLNVIQDLNLELVRAHEESERLLAELHVKRSEAALARREIESLVEPAIEEIKDRIESCESVNNEVRKAKAREELEFDAKLIEIEVDTYKQELDEIGVEKTKALERAPMPVEGLAVTDAGVTYEGLPFAQAALSRRIQVCTAIAAALNPRLKIALIRHGNDIDNDRLGEFYRYCADVGLQVWVERRSGVTEDALVIEEGSIK